MDQLFTAPAFVHHQCLFVWLWMAPKICRWVNFRLHRHTLRKTCFLRVCALESFEKIHPQKNFFEGVFFQMTPKRTVLCKMSHCINCICIAFHWCDRQHDHPITGTANTSSQSFIGMVFHRDEFENELCKRFHGQIFGGGSSFRMVFSHYEFSSELQMSSGD